MTQQHEAKRRRTDELLDKRLDQMPLLPAVVARIASMRPDSEQFVDEIELLAKHDPPFALKLLRLANGGPRPPASPVLTIPQAVKRIGARPLAETITSMAVMRVFVPSTHGQRDLWNHSLQVAIAARHFAEKRPNLDIRPEFAYLAGLLHDIGRFVMFDQHPDELGAVDEVQVHTPAQLIAAELKVCGYDHAELGWLACKNWSLPEEVSHMVRDHHVYESGKTASWPPEMERLIRIVQTADAASFILLTEDDPLQLPAEKLHTLISQRCVNSRFGMQVSDANEILDYIETVDRESAAISRDLGVSNR